MRLSVESEILRSDKGIELRQRLSALNFRHLGVGGRLTLTAARTGYGGLYRIPRFIPFHFHIDLDGNNVPRTISRYDTSSKTALFTVELEPLQIPVLQKMLNESKKAHLVNVLSDVRGQRPLSEVVKDANRRLGPSNKFVDTRALERTRKL